MIATYALAIGLVFQSIETAPLAPVQTQSDDTYLSCTYFDFNRNINYRSRVFPVKGVAELRPTDLSIFTLGFANAIKAEYKVPVDMRHVHCNPVGRWRVEAELQHQSALDTGAASLPADGRRVNWPRND